MSETQAQAQDAGAVTSMPLGDRPEDYRKLKLHEQIAVNTAAGDLRDVLFKILTQGALRKKAWDDLREEQKLSVVEELSDAVNGAIVHVCGAVDSRGIPTAQGVLRGVTLIPKLTIKIELVDNDDNVRALMMMRAEPVMILNAAGWNARGERGPIRIEADQGDIFNAGKAGTEKPAAAEGPDIDVVNQHLNGGEEQIPLDDSDPDFSEVDEDAEALDRYETEAKAREETPAPLTAGVKKGRGRRRTAH